MYTHTQTIHNFPLKKSLTSNGQILKHPQNIMCFISGLLFCFFLCFWYFYTVCHSINERHCHWTHGTVIFISGTSFTSVGPFFIEMKKTDKCIFLVDESLRCHWSLPLGVGLVWNSSSRAVACGQSIAFKDFFLSDCYCHLRSKHCIWRMIFFVPSDCYCHSVHCVWGMFFPDCRYSSELHSLPCHSWQTSLCSALVHTFCHYHHSSQTSLCSALVYTFWHYHHSSQTLHYNSILH